MADTNFLSSARLAQPHLNSSSMDLKQPNWVQADTPEVLGSWTQTLLDAVRDESFDTRELLDAVGLDADESLAPNARHSAEVISDLWSCAARMSGNPCIGIDAVRYVNSTTFQALGYSVLASATMRDAFERYARFGRIIISNAHLQIEDKGEQTHLIYEMGRGSARLADEAIDAVIAQAVQTTRSLTRSWVSRCQCHCGDLSQITSSPSKIFFAHRFYFQRRWMRWSSIPNFSTDRSALGMRSSPTRPTKSPREQWKASTENLSRSPPAIVCGNG